MTLTSRVRLCFAAALAAAILGGCTKSGPRMRPGHNKVSGQLTKKGQPLPFDETHGQVVLGFLPLKGDQRPTLDRRNTEEDVLLPPGGGKPGEYYAFHANVRADGSFEFTEGLPDGKYLVTVRHFPKGRASGVDVSLDQADALRGAFNASNSKIYREINGPSEVTIDLSKPGG